VSVTFARAVGAIAAYAVHPQVSSACHKSVGDRNSEKQKKVALVTWIRKLLFTLNATAGIGKPWQSDFGCA
jgi:hypothetical protein